MTSTEDREKNLNCVESLVQAARRQNASMVFLPENTDFTCENKINNAKYADTEDGPWILRYKKLALQTNIWLSLTVHLKFSDTKVRNTHLIINNKGEIVAKYDKGHLFDVELPNFSIKESLFTEKGNAIIPPVTTPVGNVGLSICYDARFPEMGIALREMGADVLTYPSSFTYETGSTHWEILLRARAIENQCYVIAAAQTGLITPHQRTWGHAMIIDPCGTVCAQCSDGIGIAVTAIDDELLKRTRSAMPLYLHRRFDLYPKLGCSSQVHKTNSYQFGQVVINSRTVFYKTDYTLAFVNKRCAVPGHVLVIPIRVAKRYSDLSSLEVADLFRTVQRVQGVMEKVHDTTSSTVVIQDGPDAGQTIWHFHVHILPRKPNDFPDNDDVYRILQKHKEQTDWRKEEDMIEEAEYLKTFFV